MSRHAREMYKTKMVNSGRIAGFGISEDDYSENSCSKLEHFVSSPQHPIFRSKQEEPEPEPVYTYNGNGEKILWVSPEKSVQ